MATVFRRRDKHGKPYGKWIAKYKGADGVWHTRACEGSKSVVMAIAAKLEIDGIQESIGLKAATDGTTSLDVLVDRYESLMHATDTVSWSG